MSRVASNVRSATGLAMLATASYLALFKFTVSKEQAAHAEPSFPIHALWSAVTGHPGYGEQLAARQYSADEHSKPLPHLQFFSDRLPDIAVK